LSDLYAEIKKLGFITTMPKNTSKIIMTSIILGNNILKRIASRRALTCLINEQNIIVYTRAMAKLS
jgi:hypothetical protein